MITVPLIGIVALIAYFAVRSGYTTILVGVVLALFGFLLHDTSVGASINQLLDHFRR
jgi:ascorbate-specific PTS system EIIC-type component UlaA